MNRRCAWLFAGLTSWFPAKNAIIASNAVKCGDESVATITVRDLSDETKGKLRIRAAENGNSMEAEVRAIISRALDEPAVDESLAAGIRRRFAEIGGVELELPARSGVPRGARLQ